MGGGRGILRRSCVDLAWDGWCGGGGGGGGDGSTRDGKVADKLSKMLKLGSAMCETEQKWFKLTFCFG